MVPGSHVCLRAYTYNTCITQPGELVGGLDIVREMQENGELDALLKK